MEFSDADLSGSSFVTVDLSRARLRDVWLDGVVMRGVVVKDTEIDGDIESLTVNGVDVVPLVEAELDRRYPDRPKMRPTDPAGFRLAWDTVERLWDETIERARRLPPELLHESVDEEWSFIETLRHLVMGTECWARRAILGDPAPWHPWSLPWAEAPEMPGVPHDRTVRPSLDEVLELRRDRMKTVRDLVDGLTEEFLASSTVPVDAPGWPQPRSYPVRQCLLTILREEWEHRHYAERDLAVLRQRLG